MGKGRKTTREMNVLVRKIMRKRHLKQATAKTFMRPEGIGEAPEANESNELNTEE